MKSGSGSSRRARWLFGIAAAVGGLVAVLEVMARVNVRREQNARSALGDQLYVEARGKGDPIVFLGGLQASTHYWHHAFDDLESTRRLLYVDALGFGQSPWPEIDYTLDAHLDWLRRTLVARGATKNVTIVAHSFGTILAAHYAARYPEEISHVYLLGAPLFDSEEEARARIKDMSSIAAMFSLNRLLAREGCMVLCALRPVWRKTLPSLRRDLPAEVVRDSVLHHWDSIDGAIQILLSVRVSGALRALGAKATFIHGQRDTVTSLTKVRRVASEAGAALIEVPGAHHDYLPLTLKVLASQTPADSQMLAATAEPNRPEES